MVRSVERIIVRGDRLYIFYCGVHGPHTGRRFEKVVRKHPVQIGLLTQRRDGFVSLGAGERQGTVLTRPFELPGDRLLVNADASGGELWVEVFGEDGDRGGDGDVVARSEPLKGDLLHGVEGTVAAARGRNVRLRFTLRSCRLYSYWME